VPALIQCVSQFAVVDGRCSHRSTSIAQIQAEAQRLAKIAAFFTALGGGCDEGKQKKSAPHAPPKREAPFTLKSSIKRERW